MAYTVLARKYRSQTFDDVVGQEPIAQTLKNAIKTDRVSHAYLFTGTRGVGKTTMARILAKALNCLKADKPTVSPCCKCDSCVNVNIGEDIDVIEIDGASNNSVDNIRDLREKAIYRPARARYKIYIIDEVHMLSVSAFNALLKILEEPPSHIKFIFATTEPNKVLATIQSRCQRFDFRNITPALIVKQLKSVLDAEKIKYEDNLVLALAKMAAGSMRDGLSLLDRLISTGIEPLSAKLLEEYLGCPDSEKVSNLVAKIAKSDAAGALSAIEGLAGGGLSEVQIVDALIEYMRDLMVVKAAGADCDILVLTDEQKKQAKDLAEGFDTAALVYNVTSLEKLRWSLKNSETARALLDAAVLRLTLAEHFINVDTLLAQTGQPQDKKKDLTNPSPAPRSAESSPPAPSTIQSSSPANVSGLQSVKDNWPAILKLIADKLGAGTAGLLASAQAVKLDGEILTLGFPASAQMQKKMCESNGRLEQIRLVLEQRCGASFKLNLEVSDGVGQAASKTRSQRQNEIINDPAVRIVLSELDATITGIDDAQ